MNKQFLLILLVLCGINLFADEAIAPDRPGFSTGTKTVKPNVVNIELGYQYSFNNYDTKPSSHTFPQMVLRTGLSDVTEFDLQWEGINIDKEEGSSTLHSSADLGIGGKYKLIETDQYNMTFMGVVSLPTGSTPSTSDSVDPLIGLLWDYSLSDTNTLFGTVQTSSSRIDQNRVYDQQFSIGTSFSHTETIGSFIEFYTIMPSESSLHDTKTMDGGITYLFTNDIQLDINFGLGLNRYTSNFIGFGFATRF